jgi:hypothetical protein
VAEVVVVILVVIPEIKGKMVTMKRAKVVEANMEIRTREVAIMTSKRKKDRITIITMIEVMMSLENKNKNMLRSLWPKANNQKFVKMKRKKSQRERKIIIMTEMIIIMEVKAEAVIREEVDNIKAEVVKEVAKEEAEAVATAITIKEKKVIKIDITPQAIHLKVKT